jgi:3-oxoacyl-[acyl-carrier protein] reductase
MMKKREGRVVNISSIVGLQGNAGQANYSASKAGIIGMTKSCAREFASRNITFNAVAPGFVETSMTAVLTDKQKEGLFDLIPLKRYGQPEDIANAVNFLCSDDASYITGQVLSVDGGMHM